MAPCFLSSAWVSAVMNVHSRRMRSMGSESGPMDGVARLSLISESATDGQLGASSSRRGLGHGGWLSEAI